MSEETKIEELDLIEDVTEVQLQDEDLEENVEVDDEESIAEAKDGTKEEDDTDDDEDDSDEDEDDVDEKKSVKESAEAPKTKAGIINAMYSEMSKMKKADLQAAYTKLMGENEKDGVDEGVDLDEAKEEVKVAKSYDFSADLDALVASEDSLAEGFQEKASTIFEAAVNGKVSIEIDRLEEEYSNNLQEETTSIRDELVEKVDGYLNYVVENWMEENRLAVENGVRTEIAESFMDALRGVFTEHYIEVPESKMDMVDDLAEKVEELEVQLTKSTEDNIRLNESVSDFRRTEILAEASKDLAVTEAEKLKSLAEDVDFEDEATFAKKVATLKDSYFAKPVTENVEQAEVTMNSDGEEVEVSPLMEKYIAALQQSMIK